MQNELKYTFQLSKGVDYKSRYLNYQELGYKLSIYLEMAGKGYDWSAVDTSFNKWTEPNGELISDEKKAEILSRIDEWSQKEKIRIHIGPPINIEEMFKDYENRGWQVEQLPDGSTKVSPPKRLSILKKFVNLFTRKRKTSD